MQIIYTPESIADLKRLRDFIAVKNPLSADRIARTLRVGIKKLKAFPKLGLGVEKDDSGKIRDLIFGDHIVRYLTLEETIHILRF